MQNILIVKILAGNIGITPFLKQLVHIRFKVTNIMNIVWLIFICLYF